MFDVEPSGSKRVEGVKIENQNTDLENVHFVGLCCIIKLWQSPKGRVTE